jgi:predicted dehydrogenase
MMLSTAIILPGEAEMFPFHSIRDLSGVEWDGIFYSGKRKHPSLDRSVIFSSPEIIPLICDLLIVIDPDYCTCDYLSFAIRSGCHLFISEKLTLTKEERNQLVHLANEGGTYIQVQNDFLYHPFHKKIQIHSGHLSFIEAVQTSAGSKDRMNEFLYNNLLMIIRAADSMAHKVDVFCGTLPSGEPDVINIHINFKNGSLATLTLKFIDQQETHYVSIHTNGEIEIFDFLQNKISYQPSNKTNRLKGEITTNALQAQIAAFVTNIREKNNPRFNLNDETVVFLLMEKIRKKIESTLQIPSIHQ